MRVAPKEGGAHEAKILAIPMPYMAPVILILAMISCYSIHNSATDVYIALGFGLLGFVMRLVGMSPALLVIGLVLGEMLERNLQQALGLTGGDFGAVVSQPIVIVFLAIAVLSLLTALPWKRLLPNFILRCNTDRSAPTLDVLGRLLLA